MLLRGPTSLHLKDVAIRRDRVDCNADKMAIRLGTLLFWGFSTRPATPTVRSPPSSPLDCFPGTPARLAVASPSQLAQPSFCQPRASGSPRPHLAEGTQLERTLLFLVSSRCRVCLKEFSVVSPAKNFVGVPTIPLAKPLRPPMSPSSRRPIYGWTNSPAIPSYVSRKRPYSIIYAGQFISPHQWNEWEATSRE